MKKILAAVLLLAGCGDTGTSPDGGTTLPDMTALFKLQSGTYKVSVLTLGKDGCMVNPDGDPNPANHVTGSTLTLTNDGAGNVTLGDATGTPPQPSNGASCPGNPANAACATATTTPLPFDNNAGSLVRDNSVTIMDGTAMCTFNRHVENTLALTADNTFTAAYTRTDTKHVGCITLTTDCTTTWSWTLSKQ